MYSHRLSTPDQQYQALVDDLLYKPQSSTGETCTLNTIVFGALSELCCVPHRGIATCAANILWVRLAGARMCIACVYVCVCVAFAFCSWYSSQLQFATFGL